MSTCPPLLVPAPPLDTYSGGLYSAASPQTQDDPHWQCGVMHETSGCADVGVWAETCPPDVPEEKPQDYVPGWVTGTPFHAVLGVDCSLPGSSLEEFRRKLTAAMQQCAQRTVERVYWTGEQGNRPRLAGTPAVDPDNPEDDEVVVLNTGSPVSLGAGVAALEKYLGQNYCGTGVIHAPASVATYADTLRLVHGNPGQSLRTILGTRWAFGRGYEINTAPGGVPAADGTAWMYATGRVAIWQSPIFLPNEDDLQAAFDRRTNETNLFVEQTFAITHECVTAAVLVNADCSCN